MNTCIQTIYGSYKLVHSDDIYDIYLEERGDDIIRASVMEVWSAKHGALYDDEWGFLQGPQKK